MRISLSVALLLYLLTQAVMADSKQETAEELFRRAAKTSDPVAAVKGPYHIQYKLTFHGAPAGPVEGTYSKAWLSRRQWRSEVSIPGFSETEVSDGAWLWIARNPHLFEPEVVGQLLFDLAFASEVQISPIEKISKIREDTHGGARLQCVEIERPGVMPSMGKKSLCFDESLEPLSASPTAGGAPSFLSSRIETAPSSRKKCSSSVGRNSSPRQSSVLWFRRPRQMLACSTTPQIPASSVFATAKSRQAG
jgi:hypothetical protein